MNNLTKMAATMAVIVAMLGCMVIVSEDSDAASTIYVGGDGSSDDTGNGTQTAPYATFNKAYSEAASGDTITLNGDISLSANKTLMKDLTIDLNNHTFDLGSKYILVNTGSTLHVTGSGTIKSTGSYVIYAYGNFTMDSGTLDGSSTDIRANGSAEITLSGTANVESVMTYTAIFHISINTISSISGSYFGVGSTFNCTFGGDVNENVAPPNMKTTGTSGSWSFVPLTMEEDSELIEAYIGNEYYTTLSAALKSLNEGETVTLNKDCTTDETFEVALFRWTLNLNGHSITSSDDYALEITTRYSDDMPETGSLVTIVGSGSSKITAQTPLYIRTGGGEGHVLNFSIEGVELVPSSGYGKIDLGQGVGMLATDENKALLSGAYFESVHSDGTYIYQAITTALETSIDNKATLYGNYTGQLNISSVGNWTIDLNGNTVTAGASDDSAVDVLGNGCHLTLKNGKIESQTEGITIGIPLSGSQITYDDLSITLDDVDVVASGSSVFGIVSNGTSTNIDISILNGSSVTSNRGMAVYFPSTGTLTIQDSTISGVSGVEVRKGNLVISGNTSITASGAYSVSPNGSGTTTSGAAIAISPYESAEASTMSVSITGGTFSGAVAFSQTDPNKTENVSFNFSIEDGSFTSTGKDDSGSTYPAVVAESTTPRFITGGTFIGGEGTNDFVDPVYSINTETGEVFYDESKVVVINGDQSYATFDEAIRAAQDGDTLVLAVSSDTYTMAESLTPRNGNHVTIDLGGKTLDFGTTYRILATSGSGGLTIKNGTLDFEHDSPIQVLGCDLRFENCTIETSGIFPSSGYQFGPSIFAMFGYADADTTKRSSLYVGPDCEVVYNDSAEIGAYVVNVFDNNQKAAYGVTVDFQGRMTGNIGLAFYINGNVNKTEGNVPQIHVAMPDDSKVSGGFYAAGYADWDIDSGYFEGSTPLSIKSGTFDISGGTFHATGEYRNPADANSNGSEETGAALSITSNDDYAGNVKVTVTGGTFTSENGHAVYEGIATESSGSPAASSSDVVIDIQDGTFSGNTEKGDVAITEAENTKVISGGSFSSNVSDYAADGYAIIPGADGTYGAVVTDTPEGVTITDDGQTVTYDTNGYVITILSDGQFSGVTLDLGFGDVSITIFGDVTSNVTVSYDPSIGTDGANIAFNLHIAGIDSTDMSVTIVIPVTVPSGHSIDADSVHAYSIVDEVRQDEYAYASGDSIIIETTHNTPFYVSYEVESDQPFIPFPDDDDDYVPLPPHIVYEDEGGSDDSVKIAACAAAAVIAAILAIVLATTYRRR